MRGGFDLKTNLLTFMLSFCFCRWPNLSIHVRDARTDYLFVDKKYENKFAEKDFDVLDHLHAVLGLCEAKTVARFQEKRASSLAQSVVEHLGATLRIAAWKAAANVSHMVSKL